MSRIAAAGIDIGACAGYNSLVFMSRIAFNPMVEEIVGKLAGGVFQDSYFGMQVRGWSAPRNPQTQLSQLRRGNFRFLASSWRTLDSIEKLSWYDAAGTVPEALRMYIANNINRLLIGEDITALYVPSGIPPALAVTLVDIESDSITFEAADSITVVPAGMKLLVYATAGKQPTQLFTNPSEFQPITFFDAGYDLSVPADIYQFWFDKYGFLSPGKFLCIKTVLINSQSGNRGTDFITCGISTEIMTLQKAFDASVAAGEFPQISFSFNDDGPQFFIECHSEDETKSFFISVGSGGISLNAFDYSEGTSAQIGVNSNGEVALVSSIGQFSYTSLVAAANDTAAAAAGVNVNGLYQNNGVVQIRLT